MSDVIAVGPPEKKIIFSPPTTAMSCFTQAFSNASKSRLLYKKKLGGYALDTTGYHFIVIFPPSLSRSTRNGFRKSKQLG